MFLIPLQTDNKQILRRWAPQNDIATSPQGDGRQAHPQPIFLKEETQSTESLFHIYPSATSAVMRKNSKIIKIANSASTKLSTCNC
jgi:hypothetical protein